MGWDWDDEGTVLWGRVEDQLVVQRGDRWARKLREAIGIPHGRDPEPGEPTGDEVGDGEAEDGEAEDGEAGTSAGDDAAPTLTEDQVAALHDASTSGSRLPVPWAHRQPESWVPDELLADCHVDTHMHDLDTTVIWPEDAVEQFARAGFRTIEATALLAAPVTTPGSTDRP